jgi:O-antigen/teichoic acid export membrane protein
MNFSNKFFLWITGGKLSHFDQSQISKGTLQSIFIQGISVILVFASNLLWVKLLGPDEYGVYVHIFNWVAILSIIVLGGKEDLVLAEIPKYKEQGDTVKTGFLIGYANKQTLFRGIFFTILFLTLIYFIPIPSLSEHVSDFLLAGIAIALTAFVIINQLILQALHQVRLSQLVDRIVKPLLLIFVAGMISLLNLSADVQTIILTNVAVLGVCAVILFHLVNRHYQHRAQLHETVINKELRKKTIFFFLISLLYMLSTRVHMLTLAYLKPGSDVGIFNICYRIADLLIFPNYLLHFVLPQLFSRNNLSGSRYNQTLFAAGTRFMLVLTIPLLILVLLFGKIFLNWFGPEFGAGFKCLAYLSVGQSLFALAGPCNTILMTQDKEKYAVIALFIYCITLAVTNFVLIPSMGITGSGLAALISTALYNLVLIFFTRRQCMVCSPVFSIFTPIRKVASSQ